MIRQFLSLTYPAIMASRILLRTMGAQVPQLRVLLYHDVAPCKLEAFAATLRWLKKSWNFLKPSEFEEVMQGKRTLTKDSLLLTFDDGFASNRIVAENVLRPLGINAIFFVAVDFIDQPDVASARDFICKQLKASISAERVPAHWANMDWEDLSCLLELGHSIGAHTSSHQRLNCKMNSNIIRREIIGAANRIESELKTHVRHFAYPFGDFASISEPALRLAMERYDFIYSGLRGNNYPFKKLCTIKRESLKPEDPKFLVGAFLHGVADLRYRHTNKILDDWLLP